MMKYLSHILIHLSYHPFDSANITLLEDFEYCQKLILAPPPKSVLMVIANNDVN